MALALNILIIVLALVTLYFLLKGGPKATPAPAGKPAGGSYTPLPQGEPVHHWSDEGRFQLEVLGESRYSDTIRTLAGEHGEAAAEARHKALLLADDNNPYEDKAVAVFLNNEMVGYLAPKDAAAFRTMLARQEISGQLTSTDAVIRGGQVYEGKRLAHAVWLDVNLS
ncbi:MULTISPECIES: hypothetical protein [unclassified Duganella]|uniref:hypothetical protein n=1 Tax=unclassified Duganella TaxID=2636909 RepID=UPI0006F9483C|nr:MULTISPECIES: hypothetical protein [unclassified Duganella]KQV47672.1 hypothetical protein ASD07_12125 [Duganella sp. Root336D2]KRB82041.1 hypothetical protein ASE26_14150 [Duganella sp. Root198D2]